MLQHLNYDFECFYSCLFFMCSYRFLPNNHFDFLGWTGLEGISITVEPEAVLL